MTESEITNIAPMRGMDDCPFCGGAGMKGIQNVRTSIGRTERVYSVICENEECNAEIPGNTFEVARMKWNTRQ